MLTLLHVTVGLYSPFRGITKAWPLLLGKVRDVFMVKIMIHEPLAKGFGWWFVCSKLDKQLTFVSTPF